jgi:multidrug efflux pump subunit AcrA (membrane-fusion protein)
MSGSSGPSYRTAIVQLASVTQGLNSVGTLSSVNKAAVTFPVSGRVASVSAAVGHPVGAGDVLATLDTTSLDQQVNQARQTLATNEQKLTDDQTGQTNPAASAATVGSNRSAGASTDSETATPLTALTAVRAPTPASTPTSTHTKPPPTQPSSTQSPTSSRGAASGQTGSTPSAADAVAAVAAVRAAQHALTQDQQALDAILSADSLKELENLVATAGPCALVPAPATTFQAMTDAAATITVTTPWSATVTAGSATVGPAVRNGAGYTYTVTGAPTTAYTVSITPSAGVIDATTCTAAIQKLVAALNPGPADNAWADSQAVSADELALASAIGRLEKSITSPSASRSAATSAPKTASGNSGSGRGSSTGSSSGAGASGAAGGSVSAVASPAQLVADQAAIDAASAELAVAQQSRDQAIIRSPIAGTVAQVGLTVGSNAGSNAVTIVGPGAEEVQTTVSLANVDLVKPGERAQVRVDGVPAPIAGTVTSVGALNSTTGSSTTFPVTVLLAATSSHLFDGAGAAVAITVGQVSNVLTVPSSAVHTLGTRHTVTVLSGGKTATTRVQTGAVGVDRTQITSGLTLGQRVVLAQLNAPVPNSSTTNLRRGGLGGGTGGGLGGAGGAGVLSVPTKLGG